MNQNTEEQPNSGEPIRVLHVLGTLNRGGAESRIMDLYRAMDRSRVQFDFLVHYPLTGADRKNGLLTSEELMRVRPPQDFDEEVLALGGRIYALPRFTGRNFFRYRKAVRLFFSRHHEFAAAEGHMTSMASVYLPIAKRAGVPLTVAHARSAGVDAGLRGRVTRIFRASLPQRCDVMLACSEEAGISVFGSKAMHEGRVHLVPNAVPCREFAFDPAQRAAIRSEYGIDDDEIVLGHVGRFDFMKNQSFLAGVLQEAAAQKPDLPFRMIFVGEGAKREAVREAFQKAGLGDRVIFAGSCSRERTRAMYQAFDLFLFPSLFEGLPGTVVEAQSAGLPCFLSDQITREVGLTPLVHFLPIGEAGSWAVPVAEAMEDVHLHADKRKERSDRAVTALQDAGFDSGVLAGRMEQFYLSGGKVLPVSTGEHR